MTAVHAEVLDSAEWVVKEFGRELFGTDNFGDEDGLRIDWEQAARPLVARGLRTYWAGRGFVVLDLDARSFHRIACVSDRGTTFEHSFHVPSEQEAGTAWAAVVAEIHPDDVAARL